VSHLELEQILRDLPRFGQLVKDRPYRQVWRFEVNGRPYYLKFYPAGGWRDRLRRTFRGSPALREFLRLQWLQKAHVPAPRAVACLSGLRIEGKKGDAVILEGIEPAIPLDRHVHEHELRGQDVPGHRELAAQVIDLLEKLGRAGLSHQDLHLGNFLLRDGKVYLLDGYAVRKGGLRIGDLMLLAQSAQSIVTRSDLYRAWRRLGPGGPMPRTNPRATGIWRDLIRRATADDAYFGQLRAGAWSGHFFKQARFPRRWAAASRLTLTEADWREAWRFLLPQMDSDQFETLKETSSGRVLGGQIVLGGRPVPVVVKRPAHKYWYRLLTQLGRGHRSRRAWMKAWKLVIRDIPTAWPLLLMEKRVMGYTVDALLVCERIAGKTLAQGEWTAWNDESRRLLMHRCGRLLRRLERAGLFLYDAKAENWIVWEDPVRGPWPILIDVDGIRRIRAGNGGFRRLLRSLREKPHIRLDRQDALALARGYAPYGDEKTMARLLAPLPEDAP